MFLPVMSARDSWRLSGFVTLSGSWRVLAQPEMENDVLR
jgi:hypothetical protein